ncbi:MAG: hypothetical protein FWG30_06995 [Eubacteriaceae bacterium]|nr:hypothetical protein [Eubacteriaceae bacterium]
MDDRTYFRFGPEWPSNKYDAAQHSADFNDLVRDICISQETIPIKIDQYCGTLESVADLPNTGRIGEFYICNAIIYAFNPNIGAFAPFSYTQPLSAYAERYANESALYNSSVTFTTQIRLPHGSPSMNVLYCPNDSMTIQLPGIYSISRRIAYKASAKNAVRFSVNINGKPVDRSSHYTEGSAELIDNSMSFIEQLNTGDMIQMSVISYRNSMKLMVYQASLSLIKLS